MKRYKVHYESQCLKEQDVGQFPDVYYSLSAAQNKIKDQLGSDEYQAIRTGREFYYNYRICEIAEQEIAEQEIAYAAKIEDKCYKYENIRDLKERLSEYLKLKMDELERIDNGEVATYNQTVTIEVRIARTNK